ncbi:MAG: hypothetical protein GXP22_00260, partial [Gammaproteobacteria bacterium]|nr:hypothetical protein [Gammaproteobacteria bacterium]
TTLSGAVTDITSADTNLSGANTEISSALTTLSGAVTNITSATTMIGNTNSADTLVIDGATTAINSDAITLGNEVTDTLVVTGASTLINSTATTINAGGGTAEVMVSAGSVMTDGNFTATSSDNGSILSLNNAGISIQNTTGNGGGLTINDTTISLTNGVGAGHGLTIGANSTTLSGGTTSTTFTLDNNGATFADTVTGGPSKVTGIANGTSKYDAINYGQLKDLERDMSGGIATMAAMGNIPAMVDGTHFNFGVGVGSFNSRRALAVGGSMRLRNNTAVKASVGRSFGSGGGSLVVGAGAAISW